MKDSLHFCQWVQSQFRSPWKGIIIEGPDKGNCYLVKVLVDKHNNLMRKPVYKVLHRHWLIKLDKTPNFRGNFIDLLDLMAQYLN